jgi:phage tail-like protein
MIAPDSVKSPVESSYLKHLPAIFRSPAGDGGPSVLGQFLRGFEELLTGIGDPDNPGLAEKINGIARDATGASKLAGLHRYVEPGPGRKDAERTPKEFLDWLAGWVALSLRADLSEDTQREFIAKAASLYRLRGTPKGLAEVLRIYTQLGVSIREAGVELRIRDEGKTAVLGRDTVLNGFAPHYFEVTLRRSNLPADVGGELAQKSRPDQPGANSLPEEVARYWSVATAIIDAEKPAHCFYSLTIISVAFQIGVTSHVGVDTLLAIKHD